MIHQKRESVLESQIRLVGSQALQTLLTFAVLGASARRFDSPGFGVIAHAAAWIAVATAIVDAGLGNALVAAFGGAKESCAAEWRRVLRLRVFLSIVCAMIGTSIAFSSTERSFDVRLTEALAFVAAAALLPLRMHEARAIAGHRVGDLGVVSFLAQTIYVFATAIAIYRKSVHGAVLALALREVVKSIGARWAGERSGVAVPNASDASIPQSPTLPLWPLVGATAFSALYFQVDVFVVGRVLGDSALGDYACAWRTLTPLVGALTIASWPFLSRLARAENTSSARTIAVASVGLLALAVWPIAAALFAAPEIVRFIAGRGGADIETTLRVLAGALAMIAIGAPMSAALVLRGARRTWFYLTLGGLVINIALDFVLIPAIGIRGAAWATLSTEAAVAFAAAGVFLRGEVRRLIGVLGTPILLAGLVSSLGVLIRWPGAARAAVVCGVALVLSAWGTFGPRGRRARAAIEGSMPRA